MKNASNPFVDGFRAAVQEFTNQLKNRWFWFGFFFGLAFLHLIGALTF